MDEIEYEYYTLGSEPGVTPELRDFVWECETEVRECFLRLKAKGLISSLGFRDFLVYYEAVYQTLVFLPISYAIEILDRANFDLKPYPYLTQPPVVVPNEAFVDKVLEFRFQRMKAGNLSPKVSGFSIQIAVDRLVVDNTYGFIKVGSYGKDGSPVSGKIVDFTTAVTLEMEKLIAENIARSSKAAEKTQNLRKAFFEHVSKIRNFGIFHLARAQGDSEENCLGYFLCDQVDFSRVPIAYPTEFRQQKIYDFKTSFSYAKELGSLKSDSAMKTIAYQYLTVVHGATNLLGEPLFSHVKTSLKAATREKSRLIRNYLADPVKRQTPLDIRSVSLEIQLCKYILKSLHVHKERLLTKIDLIT